MSPLCFRKKLHIWLCTTWNLVLVKWTFSKPCGN
ncbi:hypothetical protein GLYMA_17G006251v4 [Glycine max]|nr:hypothetical protein GLYMA_17G006251v4 [Glycine max]KAH1116101.1 hypothetical protein GYH30_045830 [Glycine max]